MVSARGSSWSNVPIGSALIRQEDVAGSQSGLIAERAGPDFPNDDAWASLEVLLFGFVRNPEPHAIAAKHPPFDRSTVAQHRFDAAHADGPQIDLRTAGSRQSSCRRDRRVHRLPCRGSRPRSREAPRPAVRHSGPGPCRGSALVRTSSCVPAATRRGSRRPSRRPSRIAVAARRGPGCQTSGLSRSGCVVRIRLRRHRRRHQGLREELPPGSAIRFSP